MLHARRAKKIWPGIFVRNRNRNARSDTEMTRAVAVPEVPMATAVPAGDVPLPAVPKSPPAPAGRVCVVAAAFAPSEDWQLACAAGDRVTVTAEDDGLGWVEVVREADGAKGLVPLSYLTTE